MRFYIALLASLYSECCLCVLQSASRHTVQVRREPEVGFTNEQISLALSPTGGFHISDGNDAFVERREIPVRKIGGINVYNYDRPHRNKRLLLDYEGEQSDWIVSLKNLTGCTDHKTHVFCHEIPSKTGLEGVVCTPRGHSVGVPFVEIRATLEELNQILLLADDFQNDCIKDCDADASMRAILEAKPSLRADESAIEVGGAGQYVSQYQFAPPWNLDSLDNEASDAKFNFGTCVGAGAHAYIIDTGIRSSHIDFHGRAIHTLECLSSSGAACKECSADEDDCARDMHGHGTHVAGVVGGMYFGVAKKVTLHSVKILNDDGQGSISWAIEALDWVVRHAKRPAVALISFQTATQSMALAHAVDAAVSRGITVIASAGNSGEDACSSLLARETAAIIVGASTKANRIADWSNHGKCIDIFAPGQDIMTTGLPAENTGSDTLDAFKAVRNGTSLAAAHVAGVAARMVGCTNASDVKTILIEKSKPALIGDLADSPNSFLSCVNL